MQVAKSELQRMHRTILSKATELLERFEKDFDPLAQASPAPAQVSLLKAGELRMLRAIVHVVIEQMVRQVRL